MENSFSIIINETSFASEVAHTFVSISRAWDGNGSCKAGSYFVFRTNDGLEKINFVRCSENIAQYFPDWSKHKDDPTICAILAPINVFEKLPELLKVMGSNDPKRLFGK